MDKQRVKNIIIAFLLVVNALLAAVLFMRTSEESAARRAMLSDTRTALASLGYVINDELLNAEYPSLYTLEAERDAALELELFSRLVDGTALDSTISGDISGVTIIEQSGDSFELSGYMGTARMGASGQFELMLNVTHITDADALFAPSAVFVSGIQQVGGEHVAVPPQTPVFNRQISARGGTVSGGILLGSMYVVDTQPSKSHLTALLALAAAHSDSGRPPSRDVSVVSVQQGYYAEPLARGYHTLIPVWRIETTEGVYMLNALSLELIP